MSKTPSPMRQITCEVCGRQCQKRLKSRDICYTCYRKEPSALCINCGIKQHLVSSDTGLCPRCADIAALPTGECARCSQFGIIYNQQDWLCKVCTKNARLKVACSVCGKMCVSVLVTRAICRSCSIEERRGYGICAGCAEHKVICNKSKQLCEPCYFKMRNESKRVKVVCSVCGKMRISRLFGRAICQSCSIEERRGREICAECGKLKVIYSKGKSLCKHCMQNSQAPGALRRYVEGFTSPFPSNTFLFNVLANSIDWNTVNRRKVEKFQAFGRFLQRHKFDDPLTWEAIEEALPPVKRRQSERCANIRSCLLDLGHLLVARGEMESREIYIARCYAFAALQQASVHIRPVLQRFAGWLWERRAVATSVRASLDSLSSFWSWCDLRGICSPAEVNSASINDYLRTLYWQWQCSNCQSTVTFDSYDRIAPGVCDLCGAIDSYNKVKRYAQRTVRNHCGQLRVFFDWAKLNRMVIANPVQCKIQQPDPTIRHYNPDVIRNLCIYIISPDAHPVEALILYLIIFHALSIWELQHAQLPNLYSLRQGIALPSLTEAYYIRIPKPEPSLGVHSPRRPNVRVSFPIAAAEWLKPLLERYERYRQQNVKNPDNRYLLFTFFSGRYNVPVWRSFVSMHVRRASLRALGKACNANTLRKTVGVMFTDRSGAGVLRFMGWQPKQALMYYYAERILVHPQEVNSVES